MLVLASASPRRHKLLELAGWEFQVLPVEIDETPLPEERPRDYVTRLAEQKARVSASRAPEGSILIAADTSVVDGGQILGKPGDPDEAVAILERLRGRPHQVYTALTVARQDPQSQLTQVCVTNVFMRNYSHAEMEAYVKTGDPLDKAGAYAIQHRDFDPVQRLDGCYTNVVGLPLCFLYRMLRRLDGPMPPHVPPLCQAIPPAPCQISPDLITDLS